ncbi:MAG TPA: acylphosphatase [Actinomycetota bacterium]|nr:acylphosphatase [Actinomycetota bacterium]
MTTRVRVFVTGRVQGVFFRGTCAAEARRLGIGGWVRNLPEERVEAVFEGPEAAVEAMVAWCRHGPKLADVDGVDVRTEEPVGERDFRVR